MTVTPRAFLERFRPSTLAGQTILVVAGSLLLVQLIGFTFYYLAQRNQWLTVAAAPGVIVILEALDQRDRTGSAGVDRARLQRGLMLTTSAPAMRGDEAPDVAKRALDMFRSAGAEPLAVRAAIERTNSRSAPMQRMIGQRQANGRPPRLRVQLSVQVQPDRWITVFSRSAPVSQPILEQIVMQTIFLYAMVLVPLIWFTRRLNDPLRALAAATKRVGTPGGAAPVPEVGPDDVRGLATSFNTMQDRIRSMLEEKDHMLGAIGHDLRTPLTALRVRVESVPEGPDRDRMITSIDDMRQMLDDILALARVGRDREPPQRVDLAALAEAAIDDFQALGKPVEAEEMPRAIVNVHPRGVRRAVTNLIDNAIKYGGHAELSLRIEAGRAILAVADSGPGIDPTRIEEMMQPFTRLEGSRSRDTGGTGLGLAIVRAIVSAESGHLRVTNRPEGGLIAELSLPLAR